MNNPDLINSQSQSQSPRNGSRKKRTIFSLAIFISIAVLAVASYERFWPVQTLGNLRLGMSEMEATLALGEEPLLTEWSVNGKRKELYFPLGMQAHFHVSNEAPVLYQICKRGFLPERRIYGNTRERDILRRFGRPTFVSVHRDGTKKISNFGRANLAFEFHREHITRSCVSEVPVRYRNEYGAR